MQKILLIQGHPDPAAGHFDQALAAAYAEGARTGGHDVRQIDVAKLDFPLLRSQQDFEHGEPPAAIRAAQADLAWASHIVLVFPLWLGDMPALLKGFLEQVARPGFAFAYRKRGLPEKKLAGKSARIVITMGMPALAYRLFYRAHGLKNLQRGILGFVGIAPARASLIGMVAGMNEPRRAKWLAKMRNLGRQGR